MRLNILENIPYIIKVHKSIMSVRSSQGDVDSVHDENNSVHSNDTENEDDDDDEEGRVVTDVGLDNFKKMLTISNDSNNPGQMEYNGVMTDAKDAKALMHIVDDLCDHSCNCQEIQMNKRLQYMHKTTHSRHRLVS
jgi:hypothetical protein